MGFKTEFNWVLKLKPEQGLDEKSLKPGSEYEFSKKENRVYPVSIPIDLMNDAWEPVAKVVITEFKNKPGKTTGRYKVIKVYEGAEKEFLRAYWKETRDFSLQY